MSFTFGKFAKWKHCESTQVAINIFHLFRNGIVNMVKTYDEHGDQAGYTFLKNEAGSVLRNLDPIINHLKGDAKTELKSEMHVYDMYELLGYKSGSRARTVKFHIEKTDGSKIRFDVGVSSNYMDTESVSGWTSWSMAVARLWHEKINGRVEDYTLRPTLWSPEERFQLHDQVAQFICGQVDVTESSVYWQ